MNGCIPSYSNSLRADILPSYTDSLMHYGVLGMKWGVRRYQNTDGSYTSAGKKHRQETTNNKEWWKNDHYEEDKRAWDKTTRQLRDFVKQHKNDPYNFVKQHKREIATGAAIAASALAMRKGYQLYKKAGVQPSGYSTYGYDQPLKETLDGYSSEGATIKKGQKLQRVSDVAKEDFKNRDYTYVSYRFRDNQRYKSDFRKEWSPGIGNRDYIHDIRPKQDLKFASPRTVAETLLSIDPNIKDDVFRYSVGEPFSLNSNKRNYEDEAGLKRSEKLQKELFNKLKEQGYHGYVDFVDQSKRKGSQPLIIFDPDEVTDVKSSRKIGRFETFIADKLK